MLYPGIFFRLAASKSAVEILQSLGKSSPTCPGACKETLWFCTLVISEETHVPLSAAVNKHCIDTIQRKSCSIRVHEGCGDNVLGRCGKRCAFLYDTRTADGAAVHTSSSYCKSCESFQQPVHTNTILKMLD